MSRPLRAAPRLAAGYPALALALAVAPFGSARADATVPQAGADNAQPATPPCHTKGATQVQQPKGGGVAPATGTPKRPPVIMGRMASPRPHAMVLHPHAPGEPCLVGLDGKVVV